MMDWFYQTPVWITLPLFVVGFIAVSCLIVLALRPLVQRLVSNGKEWDRALAHVIGTFGVFFGILLALVAVSVYENFAYARTTAVDEAGEVGTLYRATSLLDESDGEALRTSIDDYMHAVIELDWPQQQRGVLPDASDAQVDEMEGHLKEISAEPGDEQAVLQQVLQTFDTFIETRRARIDATALALPPLLWLVIWVGAIVNVVLLAFIDVRSRRLHLMMVGLLSLFIGLVIFVTADMDHPYAGAISVGPGAYERVLVQVIDAED
jgi:hypothetical protein